MRKATLLVALAILTAGSSVTAEPPAATQPAAPAASAPARELKLKTLWTRTSDKVNRSYPPVSDGQTLFIAYRNDAGEHFYALAPDGKELAFSMPTLRDIPPVLAPGILLVPTTSEIWALSPGTFALLWKARCENYPSSPAVNADTVVFGEHGFLRALDIKTGAQRWRVPNPSGMTGATVIVENKIFCADDNAGLAVFDLPTGKELNRQEIAACTTNPALHHKTLFLGTTKGLLAVDLDLHVLWRFEPPADASIHEVDSFSAGAAVSSYGSKPLPDHYYATRGAFTAPVVADGIVYHTFGNQLLAVDAATGRQKWCYRASAKDVPLDKALANAEDQGRAFVSTRPAPHCEAKIILPRTPTQPVLADGVLYIGTDTGITAVDAVTGRELWFCATGAAVPYPPAIAGGTLAAALITGETVGFQLPPAATATAPAPSAKPN